MRYYEKSYEYETAPGTATLVGGYDSYIGNATTGTLGAMIYFKVQKRASTGGVFYDNAGTINKVYRGASGKAASIASQSKNGIFVTTTDVTSATEFAFSWLTDCEL